MIENKSGVIPVGYSILVLPEQVKRQSESGIELMTETTAEREQLRQTDGIVIAIGPRAFDKETDPLGNVVPRCKVGDRVIMIAYAGMVRKGNDDLMYRLVADDDIIGILEEKTNE